MKADIILLTDVFEKKYLLKNMELMGYVMFLFVVILYSVV